MTSKAVPMTEALHAYLTDVAAREPEILARLRRETAELPEARMQISADEGALLRLLVEIIGARRCIEVGVFTGYSSLSVALALPEDGHIIACDVSETWTAIARRYWKEAGVDSKIDLRLAPAADTLAALEAEGLAGSFDFAFIDADKEGYETYFERCLELVRPGGLIAVDNVLWGGRVIDPSDSDADTAAIRAFNARRTSDERVSLAMLPVADGVTLARKR